jgi:aminodeoxyfutalosine deaminase
MIKKIAAHYVFPIQDRPLKNGIITYDETGKILEISQAGFDVQEIAGLEFYAGILVPGFVNVHCHLELSHMKSLIPMHTGLHGFVSKISTNRESDEATIFKASQNADVKMWFNGIAAVGDVSNKDYSFNIKKKSKIAYHSFLEIFSTIPELARMKFDKGLQLQNVLNHMGLPSSIVPHAPYSVSSDMFHLIRDQYAGQELVISMHNQETESENELFRSKSGKLHDTFQSFGIDLESMPMTGMNSLESVMGLLHKSTKCILVHNTWTSREDVEKAEAYFDKLYWAFCPNANLYIENRIADIRMFRHMNQKMSIGTDSLASNHQLSVLEEIKTIGQHFPDIPLEEMLKWATINGAEALGFADKLGSFEVGKTPGINLISHVDLNQLKFKKETVLKRLV